MEPRDGEGRTLEWSLKNDIVEAAQALFAGYTVEDSHADAWKIDDVLDHRLHALFEAVEAYEKEKSE